MLRLQFFGRFFFWIHYLGTPKEAKNFEYKLKLFNEKSGREIHIKGSVISVQIDWYSLLLSRCVFSMTYEEIQNFWGDQAKILWEANVFNVLDQTNIMEAN